MPLTAPESLTEGGKISFETRSKSGPLSIVLDEASSQLDPNWPPLSIVLTEIAPVDESLLHLSPTYAIFCLLSPLHNPPVDQTSLPLAPPSVILCFLSSLHNPGCLVSGR